MSKVMKKPKYGYDDNPDESRPYRRLRTIIQYGTAKVRQLPKYEYLDVDEDGMPLEKDEPEIESKPISEEQAFIKSPNSYLPFRPEHYEKAKGRLHLSPFKYAVIAKRGGTKTKTGSEYLECTVLRLVFKNVNTMNSGVTFSKILTLNVGKIGLAEKRKVRNAVDVINRKVIEAGGPKSLIKMQNQKVFVNNSYL